MKSMEKKTALMLCNLETDKQRKKLDCGMINITN